MHDFIIKVLINRFEFHFALTILFIRFNWMFKDHRLYDCASKKHKNNYSRTYFEIRYSLLNLLEIA